MLGVYCDRVSLQLHKLPKEISHLQRIVFSLGIISWLCRFSPGFCLTSFCQLLLLHHNCHYCFFFKGLFTVLPTQGLSTRQSSLPTVSRLIFQMGNLYAPLRASNSLANWGKSLNRGTQTLYYVFSLFSLPYKCPWMARTCLIILITHQTCFLLSP